MCFLNLLPIFITAVGICFLIRLRFFFALHPVNTIKRVKCVLSRRESRRALSLALAGTLGVGNIVGVAFGISVGGAGALFWIFISGIFSAVIKYAESTIAADKMRGELGGMCYVLCASFKRGGKFLGTVYAVLCLFLSLTMGSALQSQSAIFGVRELVGTQEWTVSIIFAAATLFVTVRGAEKIEKITAKIIPIATIVYILICLTVIAINADKLIPTLINVIQEAFDFRSIGGGVSSFVAVRAMREGYARGVLSNEAGAGTSAMAQIKSKSTPAEVGLLGMLEVFFDTALLCTLTGLAVLVSGADLSGGGMKIVLSAVSQIPFGRAAVSSLIFAFAFSTVICWYYYGCECMNFLFGKRKSAAYALLFVLSVFLGFKFSTPILIYTSDILLFFMSVLTLSVLIKNSERMVFLSEKYGLLKKSDVGKNGESRFFE